MDVTTAITWESLASVLGLAIFLSAVVLPVAKRFGAAGNTVLWVGFIAGQAFAQVAYALLHGLSGKVVADAFLVAFVAAASATGLYKQGQAIRGA